MTKKQNITLIIFGLISLSFIAASFFISDLEQYGSVAQDSKLNQSNRNISFFHDLIYRQNVGETEKILLNSKMSRMYNDEKKIYFVLPDGKIKNSQGEWVYFKANEGFSDQNTGQMDLKTAVKIESQTDWMTSDYATYFKNQALFTSKGNVKTFGQSLNGDKLNVQSDQAKMNLNSKEIHYSYNVVGNIDPAKIYDPEIDFKCDRLIAYDHKDQIDMFGHVYIKKEGIVATSRKGVLYMEKQSRRLKNYELNDDVKLVEKLKDPTTGLTKLRKAFGERLQGDVLEEKIVLTGNPKVIQAGDIVNGEIITLLEGTDLLEIDNARSSVLIKD